MTTTKQLRDHDNCVIGTRRTFLDGRVELRDPDNRLLGRYDPDTDTTRDNFGRIVGTGDLLASLIQ